MLFCQVWIYGSANRSNLAKPQTFPLEKPRGLNCVLKFSFVFWMSLYKDYTSAIAGGVHIFGIYFNFVLYWLMLGLK